MAYKVFTDGSVLTASEVNDYLMRQSTVKCLSTGRPGSPDEGMFIWETDTDRLLYYSGAAWVIMSEPRQTWAPTISQPGAIAGTVNRGWYRRSNGLFEARLKWTASAAGTVANAVTISTPVTMLDTNDAGGSFTLFDASTGILHAGSVFPNGTTSVVLVVSGNTGRWGVAPALALASSDEIFVTLFGTY